METLHGDLENILPSTWGAGRHRLRRGLKRLDHGLCRRLLDFRQRLLRPGAEREPASPIGRAEHTRLHATKVAREVRTLLIERGMGVELLLWELIAVMTIVHILDHHPDALGESEELRQDEEQSSGSAGFQDDLARIHKHGRLGEQIRIKVRILLAVQDGAASLHEQVGPGRLAKLTEAVGGSWGAEEDFELLLRPLKYFPLGIIDGEDRIV
mmetsp:Transcript_28200/g.63839  ORF Transcript_28200/g.63839 Transcript_28200/m.63839 type:complete len:212 (-) Transcript_28200:89-724(-)